MNQPDFEVFALALQEDAFKVLTGKGKDYARNNAAFHNFETTAEFLGLKREEVLAAHLYKHFAAIFAYVREGQTETEPIRGRIIDAINYLTFLAAMAEHSNTLTMDEPLEMIDHTITIKDGRVTSVDPTPEPKHTHYRVTPLGGDYARVTDMLTGDSEVLCNGEPMSPATISVDLGAGRGVVEAYAPNTGAPWFLPGGGWSPWQRGETENPYKTED